MKKISILVMAAAALACGAEERPAATPAPAAAPGVEAEAAVQKLVDGVAVEVVRCLDLARSDQLTQAIPACIRALEVDPGNAEASKALADTRAKLDGTYQRDSASAAKSGLQSAQRDASKTGTSAAQDLKDAAKGADLP